MKIILLCTLAGLAIGVANVRSEDKKETAPMNESNTKEVAVIKTSEGEMVAEFWSDVAPNTVENFKKLAKSGFYDGTAFHRIIKGFMAQGGDPTGTGMGGSDKPDLKAEFNAEPHARGVCSMARSQFPDSANSQFFICLDDARFLDKQYTVWGQVESGMEHVDALPKGEPPRTPGKIVKATVG